MLHHRHGRGLLDAPADEREAILAEAETTQEGKIKGTSVRTVVRTHILNDDDKPESEGEAVADDEKKGAKPRSMREIRNYFSQWVDTDPALERFARDFLKWANGKSTDRSMDNAMWRILEAEATEETAEAA